MTQRPLQPSKGRIRGIFAALVAVIALPGTLVACANDDEAGAGGSDSSYTVVAISELSGSLAANNGPSAYGAQAYFDMMNRDGGVNGREIEYISLDGQTDTQATVAAARKALESDPIAVFMGGLSSEVEAAAPIVTEREIPVIAVSGGPDEWFYPEAKPYSYQTSQTGRSTAVTQVGFMQQLAEKQGIERPRVAIVALVSAFGDALIASLRELAEEQGFEIVAEVRNVVEDTSFAASAANIARAKPDFVLGQELQGIVPSVLNSLRARGVDVPFINFPLADSPELFEEFKDPNYYLMRLYRFPTDPELTELQEAAEQSGVTEHMTTTFFALGWTGAAIVVDALERCGEDCDPRRLNEEIEKTNLDLSPVTFGPAELTPDRHDSTSVMQAYHWTPEGVVPAGDPIDGAEPIQ